MVAAGSWLHVIRHKEYKGDNEVKGEKLGSTEKLALFKKMVTVRAFEEKAGELFQQHLIPGFIHLSIGEEASSVGTCSVLREDDYVASTHRGHGHMIAKGADPKRMFAELFGKATGYCRGKGGSMHIADFSIGILGANGVVGGGFPIIVGAGLSIKMRKTDQVAVVFFGDGAANRGTFHEAANMAAIWKLPVVFVCENNLYASTTPASFSLAGGSVAGRASAYGIPGWVANGNDLLEVRQTVAKAVKRAREGKGPSIVENKTYRYRGHFEGDPQKYRSQEEVEEVRRKADPIQLFRNHLRKEGVLSDEAEKDLRKEVTRLIDEAVRYAQAAPLPRPEDALEDLFVNP
jgi:TPP-dependent pyruvate/acetoin dehydrogenase alpha subunit